MSDLKPPAEVVHACPPGGEGITPCCGRTPFELPRWASRITTDPALVTCSGQAREPGQNTASKLRQIAGAIDEALAHHREYDAMDEELLTETARQVRILAAEPSGDTGQAPTEEQIERGARALFGLTRIGQSVQDPDRTWKRWCADGDRPYFDQAEAVLRAALTGPTEETPTSLGAPDAVIDGYSVGDLISGEAARRLLPDGTRLRHHTETFGDNGPVRVLGEPQPGMGPQHRGITQHTYRIMSLPDILAAPASPGAGTPAESERWESVLPLATSPACIAVTDPNGDARCIKRDHPGHGAPAAGTAAPTQPGETR